MWSMEYVQVPKIPLNTLLKDCDDEKDKNVEDSCSLLKTRPIAVQRLVKQLSISSETVNEQGMVIQSGSESSLSEHEPKTPIKKIGGIENKISFSDENNSIPPIPVMRKKRYLRLISKS